MHFTPSDAHDEVLANQVHPQGWKNPTPRGRYNLVAIGGGTAGLVAAVGAAGLGARVALIERRFLGGDCLNFGCVPSKALIRSARAAHEMATAADFGFRGSPAGPWDFAAVIERVHRLRAQISHHDSAARLAALGVDVFFGSARFSGPTSIDVEDQTLAFRRAVIATGSRALEPRVEGLSQLGYLTNETVFSLRELPRTLLVIGAGPIGCELAQAFARLGSQVHLVNDHDRLLPKEDAPVAALLRARFEAEGIHLHLGWKVVKAQPLQAAKSLLIERDGQKQELIGDQILVAIGRRPVVDGLDLAAAGIEADEHGVRVDDFLRTTNRAVYAAGDVCTPFKFTHAADAMARLVLQNALFLGRKKFSRLSIPWCTFTDPQIAHVGLSMAEAQRRGIAIDTYRAELADVDRAVLDGETQGFAMVLTHGRRGTVVGGTIVAAQAGEMIGLLTMLINQRASLASLAQLIHCYPTQVEVLKRVADAYQRGRLTPRVAGLFKSWLARRR